MSARKITQSRRTNFKFFVSFRNFFFTFNVIEISLLLGNDNHESDYDLKFLVDNQPDRISSTSEISLWNKEKLDDPLKSSCRVAMRDYMSDPDVAKKVLESLHLYGVAFIDGVQPTQQNTEFVIRQLFPIHKTLFGEMWTFSDAKKDHSDTAYTNSEFKSMQFIQHHKSSTFLTNEPKLTSGIDSHLHSLHSQIKFANQAELKINSKFF